MKWFLVIVVVLNAVVGMYGVLKQKPVLDIGAQDINAAQLKILPAGWEPLPAAVPAVEASAATALPSNLDASAATPLAATSTAPSASQAHGVSPLPVVAGRSPVLPALKAKPEPEPVATAAPVAPATQCLAWGGLDPKQLLRVEGGLPALKLGSAAQATVKDEARGSGRTWVFYPPLATQAETQTLVAELRGKGFDSYIVKTDGEFRGHLSLGLFAKEAAAQALLGRLKAAGYDKAKVDSRSDAVKVTTLSFRALDAAQAAQLKALQQRLLPGIPLRACS